MRPKFYSKRKIRDLPRGAAKVTASKARQLAVIEPRLRLAVGILIACTTSACGTSTFGSKTVSKEPEEAAADTTPDFGGYRRRSRVF
jgi:hypothetical protein